MNDNHEILELMRKIEAQNRRQLSLEKFRCTLSFLTVLCAGAVLVLCLSFMPQLREIITRIDTLVLQFDGVMGQMETVLANLEQSTHQLAAVDLESMVGDVNTLVLTGQSTLEQTLEKLEAIDIASLNKAIKDLSSVIEPLAKLANMFG